MMGKAATGSQEQIHPQVEGESSLTDLGADDSVTLNGSTWVGRWGWWFNEGLGGRRYGGDPMKTSRLALSQRDQGSEQKGPAGDLEAPLEPSR